MIFFYNIFVDFYIFFGHFWKKIDFFWKLIILNILKSLVEIKFFKVFYIFVSSRKKRILIFFLKIMIFVVSKSLVHVEILSRCFYISFEFYIFWLFLKKKRNLIFYWNPLFFIFYAHWCKSKVFYGVFIFFGLLQKNWFIFQKTLFFIL